LGRRDPDRAWIRRDLALACTLAGRAAAAAGASPPDSVPAGGGQDAARRAWRERALVLLNELRAAGKLPAADLQWVEENERALAQSAESPQGAGGEQGRRP
jgi:hypothetical protein